jgi:5-oxopent-3-ene-1,2,5-tricarboxylate decarboxylase/2-hydroxyhepta-2,4-diene-1,7-dioate isomerase
MKVVRFARPGTSESRIGILIDSGALDFSAAYRVHRLATDGCDTPLFCDPLDLLRAGLFTPQVFRETADFVESHGMREAFTVSNPTLLSPLARPPKICALGRNYLAHAIESGLSIPTEPVFFCKAVTAVIGPEQPVVIKRDLTRVDPEVELAVILSGGGADVTPERAGGLVAGYTVLNDVTARDMQKEDLAKSNPWFRSKGIDTFCPMGPCIVLPDEIQEPVELKLEMRVNGEVRQKDNTSSLMFKIPQLVEYISHFMTLEPGDVISTGTPEGMAPVKPGDIMEAEVEKIGILRNPVVAEA